MVSTQSTWGHRSGGRVEQVQIESKERLFKMNVKVVSCVLALLFATANARYIGTGASGQCNEIQFFPKCSSDQFLMNMMQCNRVIQSGYPYQSKGQCMSNADQWISCMQSKLAICMSSNCPSILGGILSGMDQFMPVFSSFQGVNSLEQVYQTLDGVIDQIFTLFNINLPGQLDVIKQSGIKNWPVPLPGVNGLTIDQLLTDLICPDPGVMPDSIQNILLSVETSLYEMGSNVLNSKCSFDRLATIFSQVGVPDALIAMFKDSPQLILYTSGCSDTYQPSNYQSQPQYSSNSQSSYPSQYSSNYQQSSYPSQYSSNDQQYQSGGYQSQYSSNNQQSGSSGYQQSNYQSQYAPANNLGSLFQNLLGNIGNIFPGLFGGSNLFGGSFQDIFGSLLQGLMGSSYPSNYLSQSSGYQGASSNYGSQSSGYEQSPPSGYESQPSEYQGTSSNYDSQSPGYQQSSSNYESQSPGY